MYQGTQTDSVSEWYTNSLISGKGISRASISFRLTIVLLYEMHTSGIYTHGTRARKMHAYEIHARETHAHEVHAMRCMPMRCIPMRCMPMDTHLLGGKYDLPPNLWAFIGGSRLIPT
jgi:hypothetical protein